MENHGASLQEGIRERLSGFQWVIWGRVQGNEGSLPAGAAKKEGNSMICYPNTSYLYKDRLDRG